MKIEIELDKEQSEMVEEMIKDVILSSDVFHLDCIGIWACGLGFKETKEGVSILLVDEGTGEQTGEENAIIAWKNGEELPVGYHCLDRDTAMQVIAIGILEHGISFVDGTCGANDLDIAIQKVLIGEHVYC